MTVEREGILINILKCSLAQVSYSGLSTLQPSTTDGAGDDSTAGDT